MKEDIRQEKKTGDHLSISIMKRLVEEGIRFHGHLGPFLILGLKAGLYANNILGKDCFKTYVTVETEPSPPFSCIIDGIQIATGCTMGKRNIELKRGKQLKVTFTKGEKRLEMHLKREVLRNIENLKSKEESERKAMSLINQPVWELFDVKEPT